MSGICAVLSAGDSSRPEAKALAQRFAVPNIDASHLESAKLKQLESFIREQVSRCDGARASVFLASENPLRLLQLDADSMLSLSADFSSPTLNYRRLKGGGKQQMLAKAVGLSASSHPRVLDTTAGLGRDAFILASLGASVRMVERVPEVRALLGSALEHARSEKALQAPDFLQTIGRLSLESGDAVDYLTSLSEANQPDVIYLDPMFPPRRKSALVKKEMRILHDVVGADTDAGRLFQAACTTRVQRIVVKRPRIASALSDAKPSHVFAGKSNRFDVYLRN
ncbi:MAG: class I SAM-dependent methyltransferase [Verrucomicrobia bacterium]|jgi:16S rRNA (guanine1516-N2)-methyltransferase|nr:class I SAM-dependent methyltransferase [Verrucomicrobiota bacterium]